MKFPSLIAGFVVLFAANRAFTAESAVPAKGPIPFVAVDVKEPVVFDKHIFPILAEKCISCHDAKGGLAEAELDLTTAANVLKGGKRGVAAIAGKGADSLVVKVSAKSAKPFMPPKGDSPLTPQELSLLKLWVDQGGKPGANLSPIESMKKPVTLGALPPGLHPVYALDVNPSGTFLAAGRANQLFVYDLATGEIKARLGGHQDFIQSVRFSPDGKTLAAGGYELVKLWQVPRASQRFMLAGMPSPLTSSAVDVVSGVAAAAGEDGSVRLIDLTSGKLLRDMASPGCVVYSVALSPQAGLLATAGADKTVRIYRLVDGALLGALAGHTDAVLSVAFDEAGLWLASGGKDMSVRLWNLKSHLTPPPAAGQKPAPEVRVLAGHTKPVRQAIFAHAGVLSCSEDGTVKLWNPADGKAVRSMAHAAPIGALALSPDQRTVASGGDDKLIKLWKIDDGAAIGSITAADLPILSLAFSPDGKRLAIASADKTIRIFDPLTKALVHRIDGHSAAVSSVAFAADARSLISASADKSFRAWEMVDQWSEPVDLGPMAERVTGLAFSPDSSMLATGAGIPASGGEIVVWDLAKREKRITLKDPHTDIVTGLAFSPDGKFVASSSADKFLKVHDLATGKLSKSYEGHTNQVLSVAWKPDGKQLATGGADSTVKFWSLETGEQIRSVGGHGKQVTGVAWVAAADQLVSSCADKSARLINSGDGGVPRGYGPAGDFLYCIAVTSDGKTIAAGGQDGKILIWQLADGKLLRTLDPPPATVQTAQK